MPAPPAVPANAERGVLAVLDRTGSACLTRSWVRQAWWSAHDRHRDLIIGVRYSPGFEAHAWLEGDPPEQAEGYTEILRHAPPLYSEVSP